MKPAASLIICGSAALACLSPVSALPAELLNDSSISLHSSREILQKRRELVKYLWGADGFPQNRFPDTVLTNVASPVKYLQQLARVDELRIDMAPGLQGLAYHFIPQRPNSGL